MLRREEELRLSPEVQARYAAVEVDGSDVDWMHVTEQVQRCVVREFGASLHQEAGAIHAMREAAQEGTGGFVPLYVRYQRARLGQLRVGDNAPDCSLATLHAEPTTLLSCTNVAEADDMPVCVVAGSYS